LSPPGEIGLWPSRAVIVFLPLRPNYIAEGTQVVSRRRNCGDPVSWAVKRHAPRARSLTSDQTVESYHGKGEVAGEVQSSLF
jgi:hypothetical protein